MVFVLVVIKIFYKLSKNVVLVILKVEYVMYSREVTNYISLKKETTDNTFHWVHRKGNT